jgi:hypothetical protein
MAEIRRLRAAFAAMTWDRRCCAMALVVAGLLPCGAVRANGSAFRSEAFVLACKEAYAMSRPYPDSIRRETIS